MSQLKLDILIVPTYNVLSMGIADASYYPPSFIISSPTIEIEVPTFGLVTVPFVPNDFNVFTSSNLEITNVLSPLAPLPDGVYKIKYSVAPAYENYVQKTVLRVDRLQEKFDEAFMKLDMMECDRSIKMQQKVELNSIYFFIQGAIAAANNCAIDTANKLYMQASKMLDNFIKDNCHCSGNNYVINFY